MAHFDFVRDINEIVKMDGPIQNGPPMRWQRKALESGACPTSPSRSRQRTPGKSGAIPNGSERSRTPKTPGTGKSPARCSQEDKNSSSLPSGKKNKTKVLQDRFIPSRPGTDLEYSHFALTKGMDEDACDEDADIDAGENTSSLEYKHKLREAMEMKDRKILNFKGKAPETSSMNNLQVLYSCSKSSTTKQQAPTRHIPRESDRVLDAPLLLNDYYLNPLDWSHNNVVSVVLGTAVFQWNAETGNIGKLMELLETDDYVSSVCSVKDHSVLAIGLSNGSVQIWDTAQEKLVRTMGGHAARVGSLSWNDHVLSSGSRTGAIHHHDVRVAQHQVGVLQNHTQEVCGLHWSPDGRFLASGGNDNIVNIWSNQVESQQQQQPIHTFTEHQAAVKAIAWCPWKPSLLATGGGTADRHIRLWNIQSGSHICSVDTQSQVCSILWSEEYKELISGHGFAHNHIRIWKYPSLVKVVDLAGHTDRVLSMAMSPDHTTVASAAADETIRLWKCFAVDPQSKKSKESGKAVMKGKTSGLHMCIR